MADVARSRFDVLYLADLRFPGGTSSSLVEEVRAAAGAGYRVGVLQVASSSLRADRVFHDGLRDLLDDGSLELVLPGEPVDCGLAAVRHPTVLVEWAGGRLPVRAGAAIVIVGQVPADRDGTRYYTPADVHANVVDALGIEPTWCPVSPTVRSHLEGTDVPLADGDWVEVIDVDHWMVDRSGPVGDRLVIGRHGRPSAAKWPATATDVLGAYPDDDDVLVRVLGGVDGLDEVLGEVPASWEVYPFGSLSAREFLSGVDVFSYHHHPDLVEAFGRTVLEAMATGCAVVLPPHFEPLFGDGALYAQAADAGALARSVYDTPGHLDERSAAGLATVRDRFSHAVHVGRVADLVGPPGRGAGGGIGRARPGMAPVELLEGRPVHLVACLGQPAHEVAAVVEGLVAHRDRAAGFVPVVVATVTAPEVAVHLGRAAELRAGDRCFVDSGSGVVVEVMAGRDEHRGDGRWEDHALAELARIVRRHGVTDVSVGDLSHPDAWLALQVRT